MTAATEAMTLTGRLADGDRTGYREVCPIERALDTIGTRSELVLLREAFWGTTRFEDFAQAEIRLLEETRLGALVTRIEADIQLGRDSDVIGELQSLHVN